MRNTNNLPSATLLNSPSLKLTASIGFGTGQQNWGSERRMALLQAIEETGSIRAGAKKIGLSYKAAWDAVDTMNNLTGETLVERSTGGLRGGGAQLTEKAKQLVRLYNSVLQTHTRFIEQLSELIGENNPDLDMLRNFMVQTSIRNKLQGEIESIEPGPTHYQIKVILNNFTPVFATISANRAHELKLQINDSVLLFIDASAVLVGLQANQNQLSARNQLAGTIEQFSINRHNSEVAIRLDDGTVLVSQLTPDSIQTLQLAVGTPVVAIFKASSVMLGKVS